MTDNNGNFLSRDFKCYLNMSAELFDWDKAFTTEEIGNIDFPANNLDELADLIEKADSCIRRDCKWSETSVSGKIVHLQGYSNYTEDTLTCVQACILSAKKLRPELEKVMGEDGAKNIYQQLQLTLRFVVEENKAFLYVPERYSPPERDYSGATQIANNLKLLMGEIEKHTPNSVPIDDKEFSILVELNGRPPNVTLSQVEIGAATDIPQGTIKDKLPRLEDIGLVHRPLGKRKGYQITSKGKQVAQRNK